jgi:hypothetical protein
LEAGGFDVWLVALAALQLLSRRRVEKHPQWLRREREKSRWGVLVLIFHTSTQESMVSTFALEVGFAVIIRVLGKGSVYAVLSLRRTLGRRDLLGVVGGAVQKREIGGRISRSVTGYAQCSVLRGEFWKAGALAKWLWVSEMGGISTLPPTTITTTSNSLTFT